MKCPQCGSSLFNKNGRRRDKQNYLCKQCGRQFLEFYDRKGYSDDIKKICLKMHKNGMSFREIERVTGVNHNTVIHWYRENTNSSHEIDDTQEISEEIDTNYDFIKSFLKVNLHETYLCGLKKNKLSEKIYKSVDKLLATLTSNLDPEKSSMEYAVSQFCFPL